ncbi:MAG: hypothetical protein HZA19_00955 [Nitrospirae bacterium]|nr:hypothetical protein [Nitrospirota bacterium]
MLLVMGVVAQGQDAVMDDRVKILKEWYARIPSCVERVDRFIQQITSEAYQNVNLIANEVLSRNPHSNRFFHKVLIGDHTPSPGFAEVAGRLARYYVRSIFEFLAYLVTYFLIRTAQFIAGRSRPVLSHGVYVLDTFVVQDVVLRERRYVERYLVGLAEVMEKCGRQVVVLPRFCGSLRNPLRVHRVLRLLGSSVRSCLTEFDLLSPRDMVKAAWFIFRYPSDVLALGRRLDRRESMNRLLKDELLGTLHQVTFFSHIRYLTGRRLGKTAEGRLNLITWSENQVIDKNLIRGVRETMSDCVIVACQLFIAYPPLINSRIADAERRQNVTPDRVLVNGPAFLRTDTDIPHHLGPSLRYRWVFSTPVEWAQKKITVLLLCHSSDFNREIMAVCARSSVLLNQAIAVKSHPDLSGDAAMLPELPGLWQFSEATTAELVDAAAMVITSESGTAVEAAARGSSVIIVASQSSFTANPMLEVGQGQIWELVFDATELDSAYHRLKAFRERNSDRVKELADRYRDLCFVEATDDRIRQAFDLVS